jgi:hypothetical protein
MLSTDMLWRTSFSESNKYDKIPIMARTFGVPKLRALNNVSTIV